MAIIIVSGIIEGGVEISLRINIWALSNQVLYSGNLLLKPSIT